jgi:hypothetical protein
MPKPHQRLHGDLRSAKRRLRTLQIQHPGRNAESAAVGYLTHYVFAAARFFALVNAQRLAEVWVPTIVDRDGLKNMGIM